ncbi:unnamed protein product [Rotaria socialis]|uniref:F-box domain-containing protein n=1 Tax=Rotaria socialis TaxID=392032 RepID=A0A820TU00_9BILA|nr:unnamed protein product [Rotaria socialis]CAF3321953.1 unnamed protein product [Rotaria socialis]CAF3404173.1 unnamed protein product [Rotaria socialis]CAF4339335.1 unnamed protein product [Rotaria socialis]CAF4472254.1 unnamed protein product [Rotaria socialis]
MDCTSIVQLPNEILLYIFNKLNVIDVFYSLVGVNQRFDQLIFDFLDIDNIPSIFHQKYINGKSQHDYILDKICLKILPRINTKIRKLTIDPYSLKRMVNAIDFPQLYSLSLLGYQIDTISSDLINGPISDLLMNKITHLTIDLNIKKEITRENSPMIFEAILFFGKYLTDLKFYQVSSESNLTFFSWNNQNKECLSSTLNNLSIYVSNFDDCLYLLDGRFQSLSKLVIRIEMITRSLSNINKKEKLIKLKSFSLICEQCTCSYESSIVPLLRRMSNLEELSLQISVRRLRSTYIDGYQLFNDFLKYLTKLNKFNFNIHSYIISGIENNILSNNDIRNSFINIGYKSIDICADEKLTDYRANCHVYSLPYLFDEFLFMSNCFQGGKFNNVKILFMVDRIPFENKLFKIISQDFTNLKTLIIHNLESQESQECSSALITFNNLITLNIIDAHSDYAIQFLNENITYLPSLEKLITTYDTLTHITGYFTNDETRRNCTKIKYLRTDISFVRPKNFNSYFPSM